MSEDNQPSPQQQLDFKNDHYKDFTEITERMRPIIDDRPMIPVAMALNSIILDIISQIKSKDERAFFIDGYVESFTNGVALIVAEDEKLGRV